MELLSPAGNLKKLKFAIAFGADAIYCGMPDFSLRTRINQFDLTSLKQGIEYAHDKGKKVYVTVNIFFHEHHLKALEKHILQLKNIQPDALIVSDPGVIAVIRKVWPDAILHLSTQANCTNSGAARFWYEQGIKRIILGREVTLDEICEIHKEVPEVELEYFVHGAMCMSYSGRCFLSKLFTDRSANLGDCTQPCRWEYKLTEVKRPDQPLEVETDQHGTYIMNSKDLCLVEYLQELRDAGVVSVKIEGRAKSIYYVGAVTRIYRQALDGIAATQTPRNDRFVEELKKCQNRGFATGFLFRKKVETIHELSLQKTDASHESCEWEFCGEIVGAQDGQVKIQVHNQLFVGDEIEFVVPDGDIVKYKVEKIFDQDNKVIQEAHGGQQQEIFLPIDQDLPKMTLLRRRLDVL